MTADDFWLQLPLPALIVYRRQQLGFKTQQALAEAADVSVSTVARLEKDRPLLRHSRSWESLEKVLKLEPGFFERRMVETAQPTGYLIRASELREIEPRARDAIKNALMATLPDVTVAQVKAAEAAAIKALREEGLLPPEE